MADDMSKREEDAGTASTPTDTASTLVDTASTLVDADAASQLGEVLGPIKLFIDGQEIRAEGKDPALLYSLSLGVAHVQAITTEIELSRMEEPRGGGRTRPRHLYDLRCMRSAAGGYYSLPSESPTYYIRRASKRVPGPAGVGVRRSRWRPGRSAAVPLDLSGKQSRFGIPTFDKDGAAVFTASGLAWADAQGQVVATMQQDKEGGRYTMDVTAALPRARLDMLVALWCCHVWDFSVTHTPKIHEGMDGVRRKMRLGKEFGFRPVRTPFAAGAAGGF